MTFDPANPASVAASLLGKIRTQRKAKSSRLNGQKGGRPKGSKNKSKKDSKRLLT